MSLETGTYISDLNASNPVGSTDKVQTADDHIRLLKSTIKASFPGITGAVTATHTELNVLDGITATVSELNILDGVTLTASNINDAALKSAENVFTATGLGISAAIQVSAATPGIGLYETDAAADSRSWYFTLGGAGSLFFGVETDAGGSQTDWLTVTRTGTTVNSIALAATAITLNSVAVSDFARLSQSNTFTGATQTISHASQANLDLTANSVSALRLASDTTASYVVERRNVSLGFYTNATERLNISAAGAFDFKSGAATFGATLTVSTGGVAVTGNSTITGTLGSLTGITSSGTASFATLNASGNAAITGTLGVTGALTAATLANSDSETLVAGQLHFIDGNATLPNLAAGQWIQVINDSGSSITISKNGSDTTYWTATAATVSTSFTLAARGVLTARCNAAGSAVYVSGSGITGAT